MLLRPKQEPAAGQDSTLAMDLETSTSAAERTMCQGWGDGWAGSSLLRTSSAHFGLVVGLCLGRSVAHEDRLWGQKERGSKPSFAPAYHVTLNKSFPFSALVFHL